MQQLSGILMKMVIKNIKRLKNLNSMIIKLNKGNFFIMTIKILMNKTGFAYYEVMNQKYL